jgi:threonine dehydratase
LKPGGAKVQDNDVPFTRERIAAVEQVIRPHIRRTPVVELDGGDLGLRPFPLTLKLELLQHSGSFKARGAFANLLLRPIPRSGVVAASGGNHGAAVAFAAMKLGADLRAHGRLSGQSGSDSKLRGHPGGHRGALCRCFGR